MNASIEQGLKTYASEALAPFFLGHAPDLVPLIDTGTSGATMPATGPVVIFNVKACAKDAGQLYTADLEIIVSTPAIEAFTVENHRALVAAVEPIMDPENEEDFSAAIEAEISAYTAGIFFAGPVEAPHSGRWNTILNYKLGITRE